MFLCHFTSLLSLSLSLLFLTTTFRSWKTTNKTQQPARGRERENATLLLCSWEQTLWSLGGEIFQGLPLQSQRWHLLCFWAGQLSLLGSRWNPSNHHQLSHQVQPRSLSCFPPHLGCRVRFPYQLALPSVVFLFSLLKDNPISNLSFSILFFLIFFLVVLCLLGSCRDVFNLMGCLLEPATVS